MIANAMKTPLLERGKDFDTGQVGVEMQFMSSADLVTVTIDGVIWKIAGFVFDSRVGTDPDQETVAAVSETLERWADCAKRRDIGGALRLATPHGLAWLYDPEDKFRGSFAPGDDQYSISYGPVAWLTRGIDAPPPAEYHVIDMRVLPDGRVGLVMIEKPWATFNDPTGASLWLFEQAADGTYLIDGIIGRLILAYPDQDRIEPLPTVITIE
jgi:hypothetical protein